MNIAGPLASMIFAITVLTVFGGLFAYGVYKARERTRKKPAATKKVLQYFVEYALPVAIGESGSFGAPGGVKAAQKEGRPWGLYFISMMAIGGLVAAGFYYFKSGRRLVLQGAWQQGGSTEFPDPPANRPKPARGAPVSFAPKLATRTPSLFPKASFDLNHNDKLELAERAKIQTEVPLTILVTVDDNGHAQGMRWLFDAFDRYGVAGKATFFVTGNYAYGRPNYLNGHIDLWWNTLSDENFIGLHGLHIEPTIADREKWSTDRWLEEHNGTLSEIQKIKPPQGWAWDGYPFGSRAPFLWFTDEYFSALDRVSPHVQYDASMILHLPRFDGARDLEWPFSLDIAAIPANVELPFSETKQARVKIAKHAIVEVPVYSWAIKSKDGSSIWVPPLDDNLFKAQGCAGDGPNKDTIDAFAENLKAQYEGNRAPLHLGLHAQNYMADKKCQRATIEAILAKVVGLKQAGWKVEYESIPRLLEWMAKD